MLRINWKIAPDHFESGLNALWTISGEKLLSLEGRYDFTKGAPVITRQGRYRSQGWTEWTLGFHYGSALLQFDATGQERFLQLARHGTAERMLPHITHMGVHDHGFNVVSTFGSLRRLLLENRVLGEPWENPGRPGSTSSRSVARRRSRRAGGRRYPGEDTSTHSTDRIPFSRTPSARSEALPSAICWDTACSKKGTGRSPSSKG